MFKKITGTFFSRLTVSVLNFIIIVLTAKFLGAEARGTISLAMIAIAISGLVNEIVGGPAVVYLIPRYNNKKIVVMAYCWAVITSIVCNSLFIVLNFYDSSLFLMVSLCSFFLCVGSIHQFVLLGHQKIKQFNTLLVIQSLMLMGVFLFFIFMDILKTEIYFYALLCSYILSLLLGFYFTSFVWQQHHTAVSVSLKQLFSNGLLTQSASITHLLSSRINYYFSEYFLSLAFLGVLSTAVSITEAAMLFSSSIALITVSEVANQKDHSKTIASTLTLIKLSLLIALMVLVLLIIFPSSLLTLIFGKEFSQIKIIIYTLLPSILATSISQVIGHYYSGLGRYAVNTKAGILSMLVSLASFTLYTLWPSKWIPGIVISLGALAALIYYLKLFLSENKIRVNVIIPTFYDIKFFMLKFKGLLNG